MSQISASAPDDGVIRVQGLSSGVVLHNCSVNYVSIGNKLNKGICVCSRWQTNGMELFIKLFFTIIFCNLRRGNPFTGTEPGVLWQTREIMTELIFVLLLQLWVGWFSCMTWKSEHKRSIFVTWKLIGRERSPRRRDLLCAEHDIFTLCWLFKHDWIQTRGNLSKPKVHVLISLNS